MSQQNVVTAGDGAEVVESVPNQTGSPGFNPQHHINWMWWPLSAIPAPGEGEEGGLEVEGHIQLHRELDTSWAGDFISKTKTKNKKMVVTYYGIISSRFWVPKNVCTFYFYGKWNRTDTKAHILQDSTYLIPPERKDKQTHNWWLSGSGRAGDQTNYGGYRFLLGASKCSSIREWYLHCEECTKVCWTVALYMGESYDL